MVAPWQETALRVVVEFKKSNDGVHRRINLTHRPETGLPPQLQGRIDPATWAAFIGEVQGVALTHPYTQRQTAGQMCGNLAGLLSCECKGLLFLQGSGLGFQRCSPVASRQLRGACLRPIPPHGAALSTVRLQSYGVYCRMRD
jgi:hypothetical protein